MNTFGENLKLTVFGEPHGGAVGMVLDGFPPGYEPDMDSLKWELARMNLGVQMEQTELDSGEDEPAIISGVFNGKTTGAPITILVRNSESSVSEYHPEKPRPGHADLTAQIKYRGFADYRGAGPFSGRLAAAMVAAGSLCKQVLYEKNISVDAEIYSVGTVSREDENFSFDMQKQILDARGSGDSIGGVVECVVSNLPSGLGGLMFSGMESRLAAALYAIPGVRGVEFGAGFGISRMRGSQANDPIRLENGRIFTETNNSGGINGGITNGMPLVVRCAFRPTPSISRSQNTVDLVKQENTTIRVLGRHDPCIALRAIPAVEAMTAVCILDALI